MVMSPYDYNFNCLIISFSSEFTPKIEIHTRIIISTKIILYMKCIEEIPVIIPADTIDAHVVNIIGEIVCFKYLSNFNPYLLANKTIKIRLLK